MFNSDRRVANSVVLLIVAILLYTTWVWAGIRPSFHKYACWLACLLLTVLTLLPVSLAGWSDKWPALRMTLKDLFTDPFFYLGLLFLAYLGIQWWNSGRELVLDQSSNKWIYGPPPVRDWPSSFKKEEAWQIITWFFPAWVIGLALRSSLLSARTYSRLLLLIAYSSGLLALFGIIQFATHTRSVYWVTPLSCDIFASFGYTNHAAAFFLLVAAVATGLIFRELFRTEGSVRKWRVALLSICVLLDLVSANLTLSRAGVILAWSFALFAGVYGSVCAWGRLTPANRVNLAAGMLGVCGLLYFVVAGFCGTAIAHEFIEPFEKITEQQSFFEKVDAVLGGRSILYSAAYDMWRDNNLYGIGGWGYRYLLALYIAPERWGFINTGKANVHCDPLQYLVEFGLVGAGLLFLAVLWLGVVFLIKMTRCNYLAHLAFVGLGMVMLFSLIDLPFRCPAIMYTWLTVLIAGTRC